MAVEPALTKEELAEYRRDTRVTVLWLLKWMVGATLVSVAIFGAAELVNKGYIHL
jgi:hypothetical protein